MPLSSQRLEAPCCFPSWQSLQATQLLQRNLKRNRTENLRTGHFCKHLNLFLFNYALHQAVCFDSESNCGTWVDFTSRWILWPHIAAVTVSFVNSFNAFSILLWLKNKFNLSPLKITGFCKGTGYRELIFQMSLKTIFDIFSCVKSFKNSCRGFLTLYLTYSIETPFHSKF